MRLQRSRRFQAREGNAGCEGSGFTGRDRPVRKPGSRRGCLHFCIRHRMFDVLHHDIVRLAEVGVVDPNNNFVGVVENFLLHFMLRARMSDRR